MRVPMTRTNFILPRNARVPPKRVDPEETWISHLPVRMDERANEAIVVAMMARGLSSPISAEIVWARI